MTNIPASAREFERWFEEVSPGWPQDVQDAGVSALNALKMMAGQELKFEASPAARQLAARDLMNFAQKYGAMLADRSRER